VYVREIRGKNLSSLVRLRMRDGWLTERFSFGSGCRTRETLVGWFDLFDGDNDVAVGAGELDGVDDGFAAAEVADGAEGGGEFFGNAGAFHGEQGAADFDQGEAPFDEPDHQADGADGDNIEGFANGAVAGIFGTLGADFQIR
jgi:hypothetical protein